MVDEPEVSLTDAALRYARHGIPVFPCAPGGKVPATAHGFHDATTDADQVTRWWARWPEANIGMPTGALQGGGGLDVLDLDVRDTGTGWEAFHLARRTGLTDGWLRVIGTPSGGLHLHYPGTTQRNGSLPRHHLDFRGQGGYVLLPPSVRKTKSYDDRCRLVHSYQIVAEQPGPGRALDWGRIRALLDPPPSPSPAAARAVRRPHQAPGIDPTGWLAAHVARQPEGNRNGALFWAACRALDAHSDDLEPLVHAAVTAGLTEREARRTIRSAQTRAGRPNASRQPSTAVEQSPRGVAR
jgi:hypothetical protein